ncbi:MAG TPA: AAC(3) family N-acetyltransferase, partial [Desulfomonilaceae bacterium]|nr:AAC(3) family N-acetyltransferase [Desulfomonilaceae bacterium]
MRSHYSFNEMRDALQRCGLNRGDTVLCHSNVGFFGRPKEGGTAEIIVQTILGAFQEVLGPDGTIIVPTFTYSFCKGEEFDPENSSSKMGLFAEMLRRHPLARRSEDPIFSVAALGARSQELTENAPQECFGKNCFWERLLNADGVICFMNLDLNYCNFNHYVERCLNVPYRYDKLFTGYITKNGIKKKSSAIHFCRDLSNPGTLQSVELLTETAVREGALRSCPVGRGQLVCIRAAEIYCLTEQGFKSNPWFMTVSAKAAKPPILITAPDVKQFNISLQPDASMEEMIEALWPLPRDIVSDGYDAALSVLSGQVPMIIHEYATGT